MNEDDQNLQPWVDPELEARVVAWVLGEASPFEIADLERILAENPELAIFKRRIEATHGLVATAARLEEPRLQLSSERRAKLLETLAGGEVRIPARRIRILPWPRPAWFSQTTLRRVAAVLVIGAIVTTAISSIFVLLRQSENLHAIGGPDAMTGTLQQVRSKLLAEADGYGSRGSLDLAMKRYQQVLNLDPGNVAAREGVESVDKARMGHADEAYNQTRSPMLWQADNGWQENHRYSAGADKIVTAPPIAKISLPAAGSASPESEATIADTNEPEAAKSGSGQFVEDDSVADASSSLLAQQEPAAKQRSLSSAPASLPSVGYGEGFGSAGGAPNTQPDQPDRRSEMAAKKAVSPAHYPPSDADDVTTSAQAEIARRDASDVTKARPVGYGTNGTLSGTDTYTGGTAVTAGTLALEDVPLTAQLSKAKDLPRPELAKREDGATATPASDQAVQAASAPATPAPEMAAVPEIPAAGGADQTRGIDLLSAPTVVTKSGARAVVSVIREFRYPTQFSVGQSVIIPETTSPTHSIQRKLDEIHLPSINFREATVSEALEYLKMRAAALDTGEPDPKKRGIAIELAPAAQASGDRITLQLKDVPLGRALAYVATAAGLKTRVSTNSVSIVPLTETTDVLITREFPVSPDFSGKSDVKGFLEARGLPFPQGGSADYLASSGKLVIRNTPDNLNLADELIAADAADRAKLQKKPEDVTQDELKAIDQPFSTFSLHVSDVSFQLAKDALERGTMPPPDQIHAEEFYNAFDYGDPAPATGQEVACKVEQSADPFLQQHNLVRIAMKVAATGRDAAQPLRLTVLLDTSGSMEREDRAASVRGALASLASLLGPKDQVTLIGFARQPRLLVEGLPGDQAGKLVEIAAHTPSDGGTNLEQALELAGELAGRQYSPAAQNRIVLLTDGAANLGNADPTRLAAGVEKLRQKGISFDACGVGASGLNDDILEALTRKGNGRYYFLNKPEDADAGFARQLAGAFRPAAENVKVQVRFNPARVGRYRLIGFEQDRLKKEDFRNDQVAAAQLAAAETGVALYQVEPLPEGEGEIGEVFIRFRDPVTGGMVERSWTIPYDAHVAAFDQATPSLKLAGVSAMLAEKLRGGPAAGAIDLSALAPTVDALRGFYPGQARVQDLVRMFQQLNR